MLRATAFLLDCVFVCPLLPPALQAPGYGRGGASRRPFGAGLRGGASAPLLFNFRDYDQCCETDGTKGIGL